MTSSNDLVPGWCHPQETCTKTLNTKLFLYWTDSLHEKKNRDRASRLFLDFERNVWCARSFDAYSGHGRRWADQCVILLCDKKPELVKPISNDWRDVHTCLINAAKLGDGRTASRRPTEQLCYHMKSHRCELQTRGIVLFICARGDKLHTNLSSKPLAIGFISCHMDM